MGSRKHKYNSDSDDYERRHSKKSKHKEKDNHKFNLSKELINSIEPITSDDYFEKASEFRIWLKEKKHKYFNELDSSDARSYFKKFVKAWNKYELDEKYYKGISSTHVSHSDSTSYKWSFAKNLNTEEIDYVKDKVDSMTSRGNGDNKGSSSKRRANVGPSLPSFSKKDQVDKEEEWERKRIERKSEYQTQKRRTKEYLEDAVPKLEGREKKLAEKRATNALRRREPSPDIELGDDDIYGSSHGDDFKSRLAMEKRANERRQARYEERQEQKLAPIKDKLHAFKQKEDATMDMFRKMAEEQRKRGGL
ncbi:unnamed protein product [Cunninghamella blakesleeana]